MIDSLRSIKNQVRALRAYSLSPHRASIKINQNENPFDAPPAIKEETLRRLEKESGRVIRISFQSVCKSAWQIFRRGKGTE